MGGCRFTHFHERGGRGTYGPVAAPKTLVYDVEDVYRNTFMRGFGVALAEIWRLQHDGQMVEQLLKANGFTIEMFNDVGLVEYDRHAIRDALASRSR